MRLQISMFMFVFVVFNWGCNPNSSIEATDGNISASDGFVEHKVNHVAIIADGNRRWAKEKGITKKEGHSKAFLEVVPKITEKAFKNGLNTLTFWWFSTENWNREKEEVDDLIEIFQESIQKLLPIAQSSGARIVHLGRKDRLPENLREEMIKAETETKNNNSHFLFIALDYGGHEELERAAEKYKVSTAQGVSLKDFLDTAGSTPYPNPDILIRTSGEQRLSGFMPWQTVYTELFFIEDYFPAFTYDRLLSIVGEFAGRQRRYGK